MLHRSPPPANDSETALSIACGGYWNDDITTIEIQDHRTDDAPLVQAMLLHSATVNVKDEIGCTPLMWTAWSNRPKAARLLLEHGASINARDEASRTPLMYAAMFPTHTDMVRLLLEHGADVNAQDKDGKTALYYAVMEPSDRRIMRELLAHGANPNLVDKNGLTPLTWAQQANRPNLIALLKQYGAKEPAKRP
jgi:ankyrin repeat protein